MSQHPEQLFHLVEGMLADLRLALPATPRVLDFGCGEGQFVVACRQHGWRAAGVDVAPRADAAMQTLTQAGLAAPDEAVFGALDLQDYRIPYPDNTFDCVLSYQVFEHVQNWPEALAEIKRVLKPEGFALHIFPAKYRPLEGHVFVPFGGVFQNRAWLTLWARLGVRNGYQKNLSWREVARRNADYLPNYTIYFSAREIRRMMLAEYGNLRFVEGIFLARRLRHRPLLRRAAPMLRWPYSALHMKATLTFKTAADVAAPAPTVSAPSH